MSLAVSADDSTATVSNHAHQLRGPAGDAAERPEAPGQRRGPLGERGLVRADGARGVDLCRRRERAAARRAHHRLLAGADVRHHQHRARPRRRHAHLEPRRRRGEGGRVDEPARREHAADRRLPADHRPGPHLTDVQLSKFVQGFSLDLTVTRTDNGPALQGVATSAVTLTRTAPRRASPRPRAFNQSVNGYFVSESPPAWRSESARRTGRRRGRWRTCPCARRSRWPSASTCP